MLSWIPGRSGTAVGRGSTQDLTTANGIAVGCARHWGTVWLKYDWWKDKNDDDDKWPHDDLLSCDPIQDGVPTKDPQWDPVIPRSDERFPAVWRCLFRGLYRSQWCQTGVRARPNPVWHLLYCNAGARNWFVHRRCLHTRSDERKLNLSRLKAKAKPPATVIRDVLFAGDPAVAVNTEQQQLRSLMDSFSRACHDFNITISIYHSRRPKWWARASNNHRMSQLTIMQARCRAWIYKFGVNSAIRPLFMQWYQHAHLTNGLYLRKDGRLRLVKP